MCACVCVCACKARHVRTLDRAPVLDGELESRLADLDCRFLFHKPSVSSICSVEPYGERREKGGGKQTHAREAQSAQDGREWSDVVDGGLEHLSKAQCVCVCLEHTVVLSQGSELGLRAERLSCCLCLCLLRPLLASSLAPRRETPPAPQASKATPVTAFLLVLLLLLLMLLQ